MNDFVRSKTYEDSRKVVEYNSTFNTDSKLEFNILEGFILFSHVMLRTFIQLIKLNL